MEQATDNPLHRLQHAYAVVKKDIDSPYDCNMGIRKNTKNFIGNAKELCNAYSAMTSINQDKEITKYDQYYDSLVEVLNTSQDNVEINKCNKDIAEIQKLRRNVTDDIHKYSRVIKTHNKEMTHGQKMSDFLDNVNTLKKLEEQDAQLDKAHKSALNKRHKHEWNIDDHRLELYKIERNLTNDINNDLKKVKYVLQEYERHLSGNNNEAEE
jgi:predicted  nucleic acid-binding Zn-ribbon protein